MASLISWFEGVVVGGQCLGVVGSWALCGDSDGEGAVVVGIVCVHNVDALIMNNVRVRGIVVGENYLLLSQLARDGRRR
jgi:hypothetical protein